MPDLAPILDLNLQYGAMGLLALMLVNRIIGDYLDRRDRKEEIAASRDERQSIRDHEAKESELDRGSRHAAVEKFQTIYIDASKDFQAALKEVLAHCKDEARDMRTLFGQKGKP